MLLDNCWPLFLEMLDNVQEILPQARSKAKQTAIGNCKILGELICRGAASPRMLIEAAEAMLKKVDTCVVVTEPLAALLLVTGRKFGAQQNWVHFSRFQMIMQRVQELSKSAAVPKNLQLLLRALLTEMPTQNVQQPCTGGSMLSIARSALLSSQPAKELRMSDPSDIKKSLRETMTRPRVAQKVKLSGVTMSKNVVPPAPGLTCNTDIPKNSTCSAAPVQRVEKTSNFQPKVFHKELSRVVRGLCATLDVAAAVGEIEKQAVPLQHQEREFVDILTRACEISSAPARLAMFSMAAALADDGFAIFDQRSCLRGIKSFFEEVYVDLCSEIPKLKLVVRTELLPTLQAAFPPRTMDAILPREFQA
jgi:hypothetical protein